MKKEEMGNGLLVEFRILCMISFYGQSIRKKIDEDYIIRSENWLVMINHECVVDFEAPPNGDNLIKYRSDPGIDKRKEVEKSKLSQLDILVLSHSKRFMNEFFHEIDGFHSNEIYYQDTDSSYIHLNLMKT